jgi:hypothetical protein
MTRKLSSYTVPQNIPSGILSHFALVYRKVYHLYFTSVTYSKKNKIYTAFLCAAKVAVSGFHNLGLCAEGRNCQNLIMGRSLSTSETVNFWFSHSPSRLEETEIRRLRLRHTASVSPNPFTQSVRRRSVGPIAAHNHSENPSPNLILHYPMDNAGLD